MWQKWLQNMGAWRHNFISKWAWGGTECWIQLWKRLHFDMISQEALVLLVTAPCWHKILIVGQTGCCVAQHKCSTLGHSTKGRRHLKGNRVRQDDRPKVLRTMRINLKRRMTWHRSGCGNKEKSKWNFVERFGRERGWKKRNEGKFYWYRMLTDQGKNMENHTDLHR